MKKAICQTWRFNNYGSGNSASGTQALSTLVPFEAAKFAMSAITERSPYGLGSQGGIISVTAAGGGGVAYFKLALGTAFLTQIDAQIGDYIEIVLAYNRVFTEGQTASGSGYFGWQDGATDSVVTIQDVPMNGQATNYGAYFAMHEKITTLASFHDYAIVRVTAPGGNSGGTALVLLSGGNFFVNHYKMVDV